MARGVAKITLVGNLGGDPKIDYTQTGKLTAKWRMAVNRVARDEEVTSWFTVTLWGKLAETALALSEQGALASGRQVMVTGRLEPREWMRDNGCAQMELDVTGDDFLLLGSRDGNGGGHGGGHDAVAEEDTPF